MQNFFFYLQCQGDRQQGLMWPKYDSFYYIFWTVDPLATERGYQMPEFLVKILDYCIQGQGHSEGSKCQCLSRWYLLNRLTFCYQTLYRDASHDPECLQKAWFAIFKVKVVARAYMIKNDSFFYTFWTADPFATKFGLIVHYHKPEGHMEKLDCCFQGQGHSKMSKW